MSNRNRDQNSPSQIAQNIQRKLAEVQQPPQQAQAEPMPAAVQGMRVTKDGQVVPEGQEVPRDTNGNPVSYSVIPDATFHLAALEVV